MPHSDDGAAVSAPTVARTVARVPDDLVPAVPGTAPAAPVVLEDLARDVAPTLAWEPGEREEWARLGYRFTGWPGARTWPEILQRPAWRWSPDWMAMLARAPQELVRPLLREVGAVMPNHSWNRNGLMCLLGKYGDDILPYVIQVAVRYDSFASVLLPVQGPEVALAFARWLARSPEAREAALAWFARHPDAAARDLVPVALSKPGKDRTAAEAALRRLDPAVVTRAAVAYGLVAVDGVEALLAADPPDLLPELMSTAPSPLPPLLLAGARGALPPDALTVLLMLMLCGPRLRG